ncbi:MAG: 30S ribosomal protein S3 [Nanoarchaeota archaeon]|nr:30S ribosomal protein S3 [Nanoarchaeota archaeon]MCG2718145.1 30S ribosomal protein S3 [Nanoarchaeota archaeon]
MIERKFVADKLNEFQVQEYIASTLNKAGHSRIEIKKTPLGEKIIVYTTRPGLIVGRKGENIKKLTVVLKKKFKMENPQIEIADIDEPLLNAGAVADRIVFTFERYGTKRFKFTGYDTLSKILDAGALGAEIVVSGKLPGSRSKTWRFQAGHLKKSGDIAENYMSKSTVTALLKTGIIGVQVTILPPSVKLPDHIEIKEPEKKPEIKVEEVEEVPGDLKEVMEESKEEPEEPKKDTKKKSNEEKKPKKEIKKKTSAKKSKK